VRNLHVCRVADMAAVAGGEGGCEAGVSGGGGGAGVPTPPADVEVGRKRAAADVSPPTDAPGMPAAMPPPPPTEQQLIAENVALRARIASDAAELAGFREGARLHMVSSGLGHQPANVSSPAAGSASHDSAQWTAAIAQQYKNAHACGLRVLAAADLANLHAALARATTPDRLLNMAATLPECVRHAIFINVFPHEPHAWILGFLMAESGLEMDDSPGSAAVPPSVDDIIRHTDAMHPGRRTALDIRAIFQQAFTSVTPAGVPASHGPPPPYQPPFGIPPLSHGSGPGHGHGSGHGPGPGHGPRPGHGPPHSAPPAPGPDLMPGLVQSIRMLADAATSQKQDDKLNKHVNWSMYDTIAQDSVSLVPDANAAHMGTASSGTFSSTDLALRLRRICDQTADVAAQRTVLDAMGLASLGTQLRLTAQTAREDVVSSSVSGEYSLRFQQYMHSLLLARIQASSDVAIKARIQKQLSDFQVIWIEHRALLLSRSGHGAKPSAAADAEAELQHIVLIAMNFHTDPQLLKQRARIGFSPFTGPLSAVAPAQLAATAAGASSGAFSAPSLLPPSPLVRKRIVGQLFPASVSIVGTKMGKLEIAACFTCLQIGHQAAECPVGFFQQYGVPMPGHDRHGHIAAPTLYWRPGQPGFDISASIAKEWLAHAWSPTLFDEVVSSKRGVTVGVLQECAARP
jgi:hypothetical protein